MCVCARECSFSSTRLYYVPFDWFVYGSGKIAHTFTLVWWSMQCMNDHTAWQLKQFYAYAEGQFYIIVIFEGAILCPSKWMLSFSLISTRPTSCILKKVVGHTFVYWLCQSVDYLEKSSRQWYLLLFCGALCSADHFICTMLPAHSIFLLRLLQLHSISTK